MVQAVRFTKKAAAGARNAIEVKNRPPQPGTRVEAMPATARR
jgi:hypothetical protein